MSDLPPWEAIHPFLTDQRLRIVAAIILHYRAKKLATRCPEDGPWNLGCDCYQWVRAGIRKAADGKYGDWLVVTTNEDDLGFLFLIGGTGGVPAKFYREESPGQPGRTVKVSELEELMRQDMLVGDDLLPFIEPLPPDEVIRFAIVENEDRTESVSLVRLNSSQEVIYTWPIAAGAVVLDLDEEQREQGVDLGEPEVKLPEDEAQEEPKKRGKEKGA